MDTKDLPKTRAEAMALGAKYYFTGEPCKHGHIAPRKTKGICIECMRLETEKYKDKRAAYFAEYNKSEAGLAAKKRYYEANKEQVIARALARPKEDKRKYGKKWAETHAIEVRASTKARRRKHRTATPLWLSNTEKAQIRAIYAQCITLSRTTGVQYAVDHIYPLRSEVVCGLHVPWNLRILTREENLRKSNALPDDSMMLAFPPKK